MRGTTPGVAHHSVWFSADDRAEFDALAAGRMADDPTIYACVSAVTDPTQAPPGTENWFLLVNTPPGIRLDPDAERRRILDVLAGRGVDLRDRIEWSDDDHAAAVRGANGCAGRGDLRHVVGRSASRVPAAAQPRARAAACSSSVARAIPAAGCRSS